MSHLDFIDYLNHIDNNKNNENAPTKKNDNNSFELKKNIDDNNQNLKLEENKIEKNNKDEKSELNKRNTEINESSFQNSVSLNNNCTFCSLNKFEQFQDKDNEFYREMESLSENNILNISNISSNSLQFNRSITNSNHNLTENNSNEPREDKSNGSQTKIIIIGKGL